MIITPGYYIVSYNFVFAHLSFHNPHPPLQINLLIRINGAVLQAQKYHEVGFLMQTH